jgi:hypothetical protein
LFNRGRKFELQAKCASHLYESGIGAPSMRHNAMQIIFALLERQSARFTKVNSSLTGLLYAKKLTGLPKLTAAPAVTLEVAGPLLTF